MRYAGLIVWLTLIGLVIAGLSGIAVHEILGGY